MSPDGTVRIGESIRLMNLHPSPHGRADLGAANAELRAKSYSKAIELYDALIKQQPRNHWIRIAAIHACIIAGNYAEAEKRLRGIRYLDGVDSSLLTSFERIIERRQDGVAVNLQNPADYYRYAGLGRLLPNFRHIDASRQPFPGFPVGMKLPKIVGNKNDFTHVVDVAHQNSGQGFGFEGRLCLVLVQQGSVGLDVLEEQARLFREIVPHACVMLFSEKLGDVSVDWADRTLRTLPWLLAHQKQLDVLVSNFDVIFFNDGGVILEHHVIKETLALINASMHSVVALDDIRARADSAIDQVDSAWKSVWRKERYPFRRFYALRSAIRCDMLSRTGVFDEAFSCILKSSFELGYRLYNCGAYFIPVATKTTTESQEPVPLKSQNNDGELIKKKCPVSWYRKSQLTSCDGWVPKVSIYIPAYNAEQYLKDAIDSALHQDFVDLEVCVYIDGSTDGTERVLRKNFANEPRVRWEKGENGGIGFASNSAIRMCRGQYIGQLDSDDCLKPGAVTELVSYLDRYPEVGCVYGAAERIDAAGRYVQDEYNFPEFSREKMMLTSIVHHFRMFRRQVWERTEGFREDIKNAVDYDIFLKLSEVSEIYHVNKVLYERRWHGANTSNQHESDQSKNTHIVQKEALERLGLMRFWTLDVPDRSKPRKIRYEPTRHTRVFFWPHYASNPYQRLLYQEDYKDCEIVSGDIDAAIVAVREGKQTYGVIFHLHWINKLFNGVTDRSQFRKRGADFLGKVRHFKSLGGKFYWTIHNVVSHESLFIGDEKEFSQKLADIADVVHVHSEKSLPEISAAFTVPIMRTRIAQHGDYRQVYPAFYTRRESRELLGISTTDPVLLFPGQIRRYKGLSELIGAWKGVKEKLRCYLIIAGKVQDEETASYLGSVQSTYPDVRVWATYIENSELHKFYAASDIVVLPYRRILTSGSALLAITMGKRVIVPSVGMTDELSEVYEGVITYGTSGKYGSLAEAMLQELKGFKSASVCEEQVRVPWAKNVISRGLLVD
jgi:glycosyltransferase involved in cell wall biosynthesis